jgi:hypothetical protein
MVMIAAGEVALNMQQEAAGALAGAGAGPQTPVFTLNPGFEDNISSQDMDLVYPFLPAATGRTVNMYADNGSYAPALSSAGVMVLMPDSIGALAANMWSEYSISGSGWDEENDYGGCTVRHQEGANTYYAFWHENNTYQLFKVVAGTKTVLQSGAVTPVSNTDVWRLEVNGSTLTVYRNGVQFETDTDTDIPSAGLGGIITEGFDNNARIGRIRFGNLPYSESDNYYVWNQFIPNYQNAIVTFTNTCADWQNNSRQHGMGTVTPGLANTNHVHDLEIDYGEPRLVTRFRVYAHGSYLDQANWTDFDVEGKLNSGDDWTMLGEALQMYNTSASGWNYSGAFNSSAMACRYYKITINSTAHASNAASSSETEFGGGVEDDLWWLSDTVTHGDVLKAYRAKGMKSLRNSTSDWNSNVGGVANNLTQVVGDVPWTEANGWNFDQTNYFDTGFIADGTDNTFIVRVKDAEAGKPVFGDAGPNGIQIVAALTTKWLLTNQSTDTLYDVTSTADDTVIALAGDQLYIDGSLIGTMSGYSAAAGAVNVHLGGLNGVAGDGTVAACAMYNRQLTGTEVAAITTKFQAL